MILKIDIIKTINEWTDALKNFMINNDRSPLIYGGLFLLGIVIFAIAYSALHKDGE